MLWNASRTLVCLVVGIVAVFSPFVAAQDFPPNGTLEFSSADLAVSDDYLVSASGATIRVHDRSTFALLRQFNPGFTIADVAIQGDRVLMVGATDTVVIYSVTQDEVVQTITIPNQSLDFITANADRILVRRVDNTDGFDYLLLNNGSVAATIPRFYRTTPAAIPGQPVALGDQYGLVRDAQPASQGGAGVLVIDAATGAVLRRLRPADAATSFGASVAIAGNIAIISDYLNAEPGDTADRVGAAYVFDVSTGEQLHKFRPAVQSSNQNFGASVAVCHDFYLVGSFDVLKGVTQAGAAYLYRRSDGLLLGRLVPSNILQFANFGNVTALHAGQAFVASTAYSQTHWYQAAAAGINLQPVSQVAAANASVNMQVGVFDNTDVSFQWRLNGEPITDGPNFKGANSAVLTITARPEAAGYYDCVLTRDQLLPVTSDRAILAVLPDPNACYADANNDGQLNFFDIAQYIQLFNAGCP